jgi:hypothetical protein
LLKAISRGIPEFYAPRPSTIRSMWECMLPFCMAAEYCAVIRSGLSSAKARLLGRDARVPRGHETRSVYALLHGSQTDRSHPGGERFRDLALLPFGGAGSGVKGVRGQDLPLDT